MINEYIECAKLAAITGSFLFFWVWYAKQSEMATWKSSYAHWLGAYDSIGGYPNVCGEIACSLVT